MAHHRFVVLLAVSALVGSLAVSAGAAPAADPLSPWPTGHEWPTGLAGPFEAGPVERLTFKGYGGIVLDGAVRRPVVPAGVKVPIVLESSPYFGLPSDSVEDIDSDPTGDYFHPGLFIKNGFAMARFSVRGTGESGGCLEHFGKNEQKDQALLVQQLAALPWSNGRVAMVGISYPGTTPLEAAVEQPPALKTIIAEGPISAAYQGLVATPNGAVLTSAPQDAPFFAARSVVPPVHTSNPAGRTPALVLPTERVCPSILQHLRAAADFGLHADRDRAFWEERDLSKRFGKVRAAVLWTQNYDDDEYFSDELVWQQFTRAPKRQITSPGLHSSPETQDHTFIPYAIRWLNFWLKGIGPVPAGLGTVRWQQAEKIEPTHAEAADPTDFPDSITGAWHQSSAWPPPEAKPQAVYLSGGALARSPGGSNTTIVAAPRPDGVIVTTLGPGGYLYPKAYLCADTTSPTAASFGHALTAPLTIAGNPTALLSLESDQPTGIVSVELLDVSPEACSPIPQADSPASTKLITFGIADLRFLHGNFTSQPFPVGRATPVRVDLHSIAQVIPAGHRLVVLIRGQNPVNTLAVGAPARYVLHADSGLDSTQVTVPVYAGTLGGSAPRGRYPERPFLR